MTIRFFRSLFSPFENVQVMGWLGLSLIAPLYFGLTSLCYVLSQDYIIQDDARQHVVWLQRFVDPELFPDDLIANYFQTIAPIGYKSFYWFMSIVGVDSLALAKFLPIGLGLIATVYVFYVSLLLLHIPLSAFISTLLFNQQIWLNDDLVSATPRAFVYPIFAAFLYYLLRKKLIVCLITIALQGLFFPQLMLLQLAILTVRLWQWSGNGLRLTLDKKAYQFWFCGLIIVCLVLLPFALNLSTFGSVVTAAEMRTMPEYGLGGRNQYFGVNTLFQIVFDSSNGLQIPLFPSIVWIGFALPFLVRSRLPLVNQITQEVKILWEISIASLGMFSLSHLLLLRLHFPSRYTYHSWRFVLPIAASIVLTMLLNSGWYWVQQKRHSKLPFRTQELGLMSCAVLLISIIIVVPAIPALFLKFQGWWIGDVPELYEFLADQPKNSLIASLAPEADNVPAFAQRSTLVGREFSLPHHPQYYQQIQQRTTDLIRAQYSPDLLETQRLIAKYKIDFLLIETTAFTPDYLLEKDWLVHSSFQAVVKEAVAQLQQGLSPAIVPVIDQCSVWSENKMILLDANCISKAK